MEKKQEMRFEEGECQNKSPVLGREGEKDGPGAGESQATFVKGALPRRGGRQAGRRAGAQAQAQAQDAR